MKKIFFNVAVCLLTIGCSKQSKEIITLSQRVYLEHVDDLGNGYYEVYFSYTWHGHVIGTGVMTNHKVNVGDIKTYIKYEKESENGQMEPREELIFHN